VFINNSIFEFALQSSSQYTTYYDKDAGLLPKRNLTDPVIPPTTTEKDDLPQKWETFKLEGTKRLFLRQEIIDWFCYSGACDTISGACINVTRESKILKLYKSVRSSSQSMHTLSLQYLFIGIVLRLWLDEIIVY